MKMAKKIIPVTVIALAASVIALVAVIFIRGHLMYRSAFERQSAAAALETLRQSEHASVSELPEFYINAVICTEDRRFYEHGGVDLKAKTRAVLHDISTLSFAQGGSTITEQVAKNLWFTQDKKLERKVAELFAAKRLEKELTKDEIFELYVNSIYFGDGYYVILAASEGYFGKAPSELSEYECAVLAGLPNAPSILANGGEPVKQRTRQVLNSMTECGKLSGEQADEILEAAA